MTKPIAKSDLADMFRKLAQEIDSNDNIDHLPVSWVGFWNFESHNPCLDYSEKNSSITVELFARDKEDEFISFYWEYKINE